MTGTTNASDKSADVTLWVAQDIDGELCVWSQWRWTDVYADEADEAWCYGWNAIGHPIGDHVPEPSQSASKPRIYRTSGIVPTSVRRATRDEYEALLAMARAEAAVRGDT